MTFSKMTRLLCALCALLCAVSCFTGCGDKTAEEFAKRYEDGNTYYTAGDYEKAALEFEEALKLDDESVDAYYMLAMTYKKLDRLDDAKAVLKDGIEKTDSKKLKKLNNSLTDKKEKDEETTLEDTTAETTAETTAPETTAPETTAPVTEPVTQAVTNPQGEELLGAGSATEPFLEIPNIEGNSMSVTTIAIPAGSSRHYAIYRVGGMMLTINNPNAYVVCNGVRYDANGSTLTMMVPAALASDAITFEIGNKGGAPISFKLVFTNLTGTQANPHIISAGTIGNTQTISLPEGDSDGYTYKYYAEKTGTVRFTVSASADFVMSVTNNRNSTQRTSDADMAPDTNYIDIQVNAGDELIIIVGASRTLRGKYPAVTVTWSGKYI